MPGLTNDRQRRVIFVEQFFDHLGERSFRMEVVTVRLIISSTRTSGSPSRSVEEYW